MNIKKILQHETAIALLFYLLLICILYGQVIFFGKSLLPNLYYPNGVAPMGYQGRKPVNTFWVDLGTPTFYEEPTNRLIANIYAKGDIPLWNPYQGCGTPLAAQYSTRAFFPYQILENLSPYWTWDMFILGRLLIAGFFTYLFLRILGISFTSSLLGGIFYMLSGSMVWFINLEQYTNVAIMVPIFLFSIEKFIKCKNITSFVLCAIMLALVLISGQPEIAIYVLLFGTAYYLFRVLMKKPKLIYFLKRVVILIVLCAVGLGLSAVLILPFLELIANAYHCHPSGGTMGIRGPAPLYGAFAILAPLFSEWQTFYRCWPANGLWDFLGGYSGVLVVYLTFLGLFYKNTNRRYLLFFFIFAFVIILKNFDCPLVNWIGLLPLLDQSWSPRWAGPVWTYSLACSGALGLEIILQSHKTNKVLFRTVSLIFLCFMGFFLLNTQELLLKISDAGWKVFLPFLIIGPIIAFVVFFIAYELILYHRDKKWLVFAIISLAILELSMCIPKGTESLWLRIIPFFIGLLVVFALVKGKWNFVISGFLLAILSYTYLDVSAPRGFPDFVHPYPQEPYIRFLKNKADYNRVVGGAGILMPNNSSTYEIYDIRYINSLSVAWYQYYVDRHLLKLPHYFPTDRLWFAGIPDRQKEDKRSIYTEIKDFLPYYSFLGTKYILAPSYFSYDLPCLYDKEIKIYDNPDALPRVFVAHKINYACSYKEAQKIIGKPNLDLENTVALEEKAPQGYNPSIIKDNSKAKIKDYQTNKVTIGVTLENPGILVLTDTYYPGWEVFVNGNPSKIYRVNGLVRGVFLDKGNHEVVFKYFPRSFKIGLAITIFSLLLCLFCLVAGIFYRRGKS